MKIFKSIKIWYSLGTLNSNDQQYEISDEIIRCKELINTNSLNIGIISPAFMAYMSGVCAL